MTARAPIAVAALVRDGLLLMAHRHPRRQWYPGCWDLVGGHIEAGESPEQAIALCRKHPRAKTHRAWRYVTLDPGTYLWTSPLGYQYLVNDHGTRDLDKLDHQCPRPEH